MQLELKNNEKEITNDNLKPIINYYYLVRGMPTLGLPAFFAPIVRHVQWTTPQTRIEGSMFILVRAFFSFLLDKPEGTLSDGRHA